MIWFAIWGVAVGLICGFFAGLAFGARGADVPPDHQNNKFGDDWRDHFVPVGGSGPKLSPTLTEEDAARMATASLDPGGRL